MKLEIVTWSRHQRYLWLGKWESLTLSHHSVKVDCYRCYGRGNITLLFCNMTSSNHMIKRTWLVEWELLKISHHTANLRLRGLVECRYNIFILSRYITWPHGQSVYEFVILNFSCNPVRNVVKEEFSIRFNYWKWFLKLVLTLE